MKIEIGFPEDLVARETNEVFESLVAADITAMRVLVEYGKGTYAEQNFRKSLPGDGGVLMLRSIPLAAFHEKDRLLERLGRRLRHGYPHHAYGWMCHSSDREFSRKAAQVI
ncbi:hypothetical protein GGD57_005116 [Rhizobium esperanzae]|uniref:Uncharacterized protein n=1 Tax=Rhizobium esperanzae TaxID=1967781 RepID=A0A7W6R7W5_9HYPH|nr:hypothetical protein [Rhizobium esperanzae]